MYDEWAGYDENANGLEQATGAILEDVPIDGEDPNVALFPASAHDEDHTAGLHQRKQAQEEAAQRDKYASEARAALRRQRYTSLLDRILRFVEDRHVLPASWFVRTTESGQRFPPFVYTIRYSCTRWFKTLITAVSFAASLLWIIQLAVGAPSIVLHDGTSVVNLYSPATTYTVDLSSARVAAWLEAERGSMHVIRGSDLSDGYFPADVYHAAERRNITLDWLGQALHDACAHDDEACACMPAVEIGVLADVIYIDGTVMIKPTITKKSDEHGAITYGDGTKASQPMAVKVEYTHRDGAIDRRQETLHAAACIARSLELVGKL